MNGLPNGLPTYLMKYLKDIGNDDAIKAIQNLPYLLFSRYNFLVKKYAKNTESRMNFWLIAWKAFELYFDAILRIKPENKIRSPMPGRC